MSRPNPVWLAAFLIAFASILLAPYFMSQYLYVSTFEGDTLHTIEIVLRAMDGEIQHVDFHTPIGFLAFAPIQLFLAAGFPFGMAFICGQTLIAAVLLPAIWWVGQSRFSRRAAYAFGGGALLILLTMAPGNDIPAGTVGLHYNRWGWGYAFIAVALALMPARGADRPRLDGILVGLSLAAVALTKATYFLAFAPLVGLALLARGRWSSIVTALFAGIAVAGIVTLWRGVGFWTGYVEDLLWVAGSSVRSFPSAPLPELIVGTAHVGGTIAAIGGALYVRRSGQMVAGYGLLLLYVACVYATYQNFENPPLWILLLAPVLFSLMPEDADTPAKERARKGVFVCAVLASAYAIPLAGTMAMTTLHALSAPSGVVAVDLGRNPVLRDVMVSDSRSYSIRAMDSLTREGGLYADVRSLMSNEQEERVLPDPDPFRGIPVPSCRLEGGFAGSAALLARSLEELGGRVFVTDVVTPYWVFADVPRLAGAAPWNYGSLKGLENADYVVVPACVNSTAVRRAILDALDDAEVPLTEAMRTPLFVAYRIDAE